MNRPSHILGLLVATLLVFSVVGIGFFSLQWSNVYAETFPGVNGKIAFVGQPARYSSQHIYTMNEDGSGLTDVTPTAIRAESPSFSSDGKKIAFDDIDSNSEPQIHIMNADGSGMMKITSDALGSGDPTFSPGGTRIAFTHQKTSGDDGAFEIYVMNLDGSSKINLTNNAFRDESPSWSPDGTKIVFGSLRQGNQDIYVMNSDGSGVKRLTDSTTGFDYQPHWSPDGTKILFNRVESGTNTIWVMNADGSAQTKLSKPGVEIEVSPVFSPDGKKVVFTTHEQTANAVWIRNLDGTGETQLKTMYFLSSPSFGPQPQQVTLSIRSQDTNGKAISGLWTVLYDGSGNVLKTGFSPVTFTLNFGQQYRIGMSNFGSYSFDHWLDNNSSANPRNISIKTNTQLTAVYTTSNAFPITHMSDTTASAGYGVFSSKPSRAELVTPSSQLIGDKVDSITLRLKKVGAITGTAEIGVFNSNLSVKKLFGTLNVATLTTGYADYEFHLTGGELYTIQSGDRIGIKYTGGSTTTWVSVMLDLDAADPFDGTNSYAQYYQGSWLSNTDRDMYMILKQTHG